MDLQLSNGWLSTVVRYTEHEGTLSLSVCNVSNLLPLWQDDDTFVVGVRNDYLLHCYNLTSGIAELVSCALFH